MGPEHVCTYRLQLTSDFDFDDAARIATYLARLGVSHVYLSPIAQAAPGSRHGYDVCDPTRISSEVGGPEAYARLSDALTAAGIGQMIDLVPNHMAVALPQNRWLDDVLRHGPASRYAPYFDLRWLEPEETVPYLELPVLADDYATALSRGDIRLVAAEGGPRVRYGDLSLPIRPGTDLPDAGLTPQQLDVLLRRQHYRLVSWRVSDQRLSYRRFFDVTSLIGLRVEEGAVFDDEHALPLRLVREGLVDGLRVDHIDGLRDPTGYLRRLRASAPGCRVVVEKILGPDESLAADWPVDGSTGYDFLNLLNGLFVEPAAESPLTDFYAEFTARTEPYEAVLDASKRNVLARLLNAELSQLAGMLRDAAGPAWDDEACSAVLTEVLVAFPVYRTYVRPDEPASSQDAAVIAGALDRARGRLEPHLRPLLDLLAGVLLIRVGGDDAVELAPRFQQLSGPVMAKGAEDTAFYNYNRLVSLNEVGGDPARFGVSVDAFHAFCSEVARRRPRTMLATATHDTKRGEDARLRIDALSQIAGDWIEAVRRWAALNQPLRPDGLPDRNFEYFFYQNLVGAWPIRTQRALDFAAKAAREAKAYTSWRRHDEAYESALRRFVEGVLANRPFLDDLEAFVARLAPPATRATLAQTLLKLTAPGVPDIYQGCELLDLSLVDPDNRRPVDYDLREGLLQRLSDYDTAAQVLAANDPGMAKLWLTHRVLQTRRRHAEAFRGDYAPLAAEPSEGLLAFVRGGEVISIARTRGDADATIELPSGAWLDVLSNRRHGGGRTPITDLLRDVNVALLVREAAS